MGELTMARTAVTSALAADKVAAALADQLAGPGLVIAFVFADWRIDPGALARALAPRLAPGRLVGATTVGVVGPGAVAGTTAVAIGFYGDWIAAGVGVAERLADSPLARARDALAAAAAELGTTPEALDPARHIGVTFVDGTCGNEELFCVGSAAPAPQIRTVGSCAATSLEPPGRAAYVIADDRALADAGVVAVLDSKLPFHVVSSAHLVATDARTVVTAAHGRTIDELDGHPALPRFRALLAHLRDDLPADADLRARYAFARYIDGVPYVRSLRNADESGILLATNVEPGHVLRIMRPGDLIGTTRADLERARERVGGTIGALLVFSCMSRHWEADRTGRTDELTAVYAAHGALGCQSAGEQTGMLLVNHTLMGLAFGAPLS